MAGSRTRTAIITGAAGGLGRALAVRLARDGWHVAICDVDEPGSRETLRLVEAAGGSGQVERLDVTAAGDWLGLRERLEARWERLDLLVNNAGVAGAGAVGRFPLEDWRWLLDVNLLGVVHGCHVMVDWLTANPHGGHVVNTASLAAVASAPTMAAYNASKAAVVSLSETLYAELRPRGVGVTVLCPGFVRTALLDGARWHPPRLRARAERHFAAARIDSADVAEATLRAIRRGRLYVVLPLRGRLVWWLKRLLPERFMRLVSRLVPVPD